VHVTPPPPGPTRPTPPKAPACTQPPPPSCHRLQELLDHRHTRTLATTLFQRQAEGPGGRRLTELEGASAAAQRGVNQAWAQAEQAVAELQEEVKGHEATKQALEAATEEVSGVGRGGGAGARGRGGGGGGQGGRGGGVGCRV
jgi:hypothetical protein